MTSYGIVTKVVPVLILPGQRDRPWRLTSDLPRALLDTLIAAIGYLLWVALLPSRQVTLINVNTSIA